MRRLLAPAPRRRAIILLVHAVQQLRSHVPDVLHVQPNYKELPLVLQAWAWVQEVEAQGPQGRQEGQEGRQKGRALIRQKEQEDTGENCLVKTLLGVSKPIRLKRY